MKKSNLATIAGALLLLAFSTSPLNGQTPPYFFGKKHLAELNAGLLRAPAPGTVTQSQPLNGASVETRAFAGGTAAARYHFSFLPRWSAHAGIGAGYYPFSWRINATPEWLGQERGFNNQRLDNSDGVFFSGNLGVAYHLLSGGKHLLAIGGGLQGVYFSESKGGSGIGIGEGLAGPLQFSSVYAYGKDTGGGLFPAGYLTVQYFQKVNEWLVFSAALEGAWSGEEPGEFSSTLTGAGETLTGAYRQQYLPVSLRVGLGYTFGN
ncbi:MAG: hypothetical protein J5I94_00040 [Phaeodactylibacter sp.]|nr:hypothetical protein [Phaeodactylibacter sp.]